MCIANDLNGRFVNGARPKPYFTSIIEEELSETAELKLDELPKPAEIYAFLALHNLEIEYKEIEAVKAQIENQTLRRGLEAIVKGLCEQAGVQLLMCEAIKSTSGGLYVTGAEYEIEAGAAA